MMIMKRTEIQEIKSRKKRTARAKTDIFPLISLFRAHRETSLFPRPKLEKGSGEGSEEDGGEEGTNGAPLPTSKSKSSTDSGSIITRGSTRTGSVSASSFGDGGGGMFSLSSAPAVAAVIERRRTREEEWRREERGDDDKDGDERQQRQERNASIRSVVGVALVAVVVVAAAWLGPARACVVERIARNRRTFGQKQEKKQERDPLLFFSSRSALCR
jgi:hypothetical protein